MRFRSSNEGRMCKEKIVEREKLTENSFDGQLRLNIFLFNLI